MKKTPRGAFSYGLLAERESVNGRAAVGLAPDPAPVRQTVRQRLHHRPMLVPSAPL